MMMLAGSKRQRPQSRAASGREHFRAIGGLRSAASRRGDNSIGSHQNVLGCVSSIVVDEPMSSLSCAYDAPV